ncbi:MAG: hypothetical protein FWF72_07125 [Paludibacter sp.]|nr:hypothetical protein [Paludibacter sp.]
MAIETKLKYKISDSEIIVYSSRTLKTFAVAFGIALGATYAAIFMMRLYFGGEMKIKMESEIFSLLFLLAPVLFLMFFGNRQVIFSQREETVYKSYGLGRKKIARFSEIAAVRYVGGSNASYRIFFKSDPYGKGVGLLKPAPPNAQQTFKKNIMPALMKMLNLSESAAELPPINLENMRYYARKGNIFTVKRRWEIGYYTFLFCLTAGLLCWGISSKNNVLIFCTIPPMLIAIGFLLHKRKFDVENHIFINSIAFFYKKMYRFE